MQEWILKVQKYWSSQAAFKLNRFQAAQN